MNLTIFTKPNMENANKVIDIPVKYAKKVKTNRSGINKLKANLIYFISLHYHVNINM